MAGLTLTSLGGAGTVTGSKHLLQGGGRTVLVDCGLFQGIKNLREANWRPLPIAADSIDAVIVTHGHLDHVGYLPRLVREGFTGRIYATPATRAVAEIILRDSAHIQQRDADFANQRKSSRHHPALPLYDVDDVEATLPLFQTRPPHVPFTPLPGVDVVYRGAGHILGAATATITWDESPGAPGGRQTTVAFTGDLGRYDDPLMFDPEPVRRADVLVTESTYGDRLRQATSPLDELERIVTGTIGRGGTVLIPAFAVGRTQTILYYLWQLLRQGRIAPVPIYVDSPMAINAGELLRHFPDQHRLDPALTEQLFAIADYTRDPEASKEISADRSPKIVLSASGMATGGRILHHLAAFAADPRTSIVLAGYQSVGTRGRSLADGARFLKLYGEWVPINARIEDLHMFSAHADGDELIRWMRGFTHAPERSFIVHGEPAAAEALRHRMHRELGWQATVSVPNQVYAL
ncbi:putative ribonuclease [Gordonia hirsuta DSM 44140 = NBRC 16056]|uniref:Putative ribonuclease n=1 Tax=Gordonia hirsuta DSM 44140 = NBRC 16056 TaxID=1121927 RepID=L7L8G1_9ACTN|nr:MBL fold metallo-hydrolase [Gordonia hirsuta]GAC56342.1 putative ribonuclease [Gordonia hirsuta DSM 44140 = NBRC 16056]